MTVTRIAITGAAGYLGGIIGRAAVAEPDVRLRSVTRSPAAWVAGEAVAVPELQTGAQTALEGMDAVVHLAGPNEVEAGADPDGTIASAISAARAVGKACAASGVRRLVYLSTVHVYGAALIPGAVIDELVLPAPRHPYALARLACEHVLAEVAGPCELTVFRVTNGVGAPVDPAVNRWTLVANDLCRQAARGGPIRLTSSGLQWRDFIAAGDIARAVLAVAGRAAIPPGTYNLASGRCIQVLTLARMIAEEAAKLGLGAQEIHTGPSPVQATEPYTVSVDRLAALGYRATVPLTQAISETINACVKANGE